MWRTENETENAEKIFFFCSFIFLLQHSIFTSTVCGHSALPLLTVKYDKLNRKFNEIKMILGN